MFLLLAAAFYAGMMGGGDVKLAGALALWFPPLVTLKFLVLMSIAGGVLTLIVLAWHRSCKREGRPGGSVRSRDRIRRSRDSHPTLS